MMMIVIKCDNGKSYRVRVNSVAKDDIFILKRGGESKVSLRITKVIQTCYEEYDDHRNTINFKVDDIEATAEYVD